MSGVATNLAFQVGYYYIAGQPANFKPSVIQSATEIYTKSQAGKWQEVATLAQLFFTSLVKYEAPNNVQAVKPIGG